MSTGNLHRRISRMLIAIEQRVEASKPTHGVIFYKPIHCEPPYPSMEELNARIMAEQPAVRERVEQLRSQGVYAFFWLPEKDPLPGESGYAA